MRLNTLGHGLAISAVSALVIAGLTMGAAPANAADGAGVRLLSQQSGIASVRQDGTGYSYRSVTLAAERLDPAAAITFEVNPDPAATNDATGWVEVVGSDATGNGRYVAVEWTPDSLLVDTDIALRAVATSGPTTTYSTRNNVALDGQQSAVHSVAIGPKGSFFPQPYADSSRTASLMAVSGTTSAETGPVELSAWNATSGAFEGTTAANAFFIPIKTSEGYVTPRFQGVLDIAGFDAGDGDPLAIRAQRDSDSVKPVQLVQQAISSIRVGGVPEIAGPETTSLSLTVSDGSSRGVIGAEVRRSSDGTVVGYTGYDGYLAFEQPSGTTETYYANTTDADAYESDVDVITEPVTVPAYVPVATATEAEFADGTVFDDQEYAKGDIALQVVDGRGEPFATTEMLTYSLYRTEDGPSDPVTESTNEDGRLVVPFDPSAEDGEYTLTYSVPESADPDGEAATQSVTFVAGDAVLGLTPLVGTAPSGGTISYEGTLTVEGQPLADRDVDLAYTRGTEQAPGTDADAALVIGAQRTLTGAATTDDDGTFTVTVGDVAEAGGPAEPGGKVKVTALGDTIDATADFTQVVTPPTPTDPPTTTPTPTTPTPTSVPSPAPGKITVSLRLTGSDAGPESDKLRVRGPRSVAGQKVRIHVRTPGGSWRAVKGVELDDTGDASLTLRDSSGDQVTRYRVRLVPNPVAKAFTSGALRLL